MTWKGIWEGIASLFEIVLFKPYDWLTEIQFDSWYLANSISWVFLLIGSVAFVYWLIKLKDFNENTEVTYTYKDTP
ncbi:uracil phosphoribosyltransferase [Aequorivita sp. Q41]|uniref:DUF6341 family protein n=1 Tax=Aequorivita sp. Q41 TaxID=3153300 RepID=UPI003241D5D1